MASTAVDLRVPALQAPSRQFRPRAVALACSSRSPNASS